MKKIWKLYGVELLVKGRVDNCSHDLWDPRVKFRIPTCYLLTAGFGANCLIFWALVSSPDKDTKICIKGQYNKVLKGLAL